MENDLTWPSSTVSSRVRCIVQRAPLAAAFFSFPHPVLLADLVVLEWCMQITVPGLEILVLWEGINCPNTVSLGPAHLIFISWRLRLLVSLACPYDAMQGGWGGQYFERPTPRTMAQYDERVGWNKEKYIHICRSHNVCFKLRPICMHYFVGVRTASSFPFFLISILVKRAGMEWGA